jgi:ABC-type uncharacterized transport system auxiliary subunit
MRTLIAIAALFTAGCATTRPVHYYSIMPAGTPLSAGKPDGPTVLVGLIATSERLQNARIRYRTGDHEAGAYEYQRWTERPGEMVRDSLRRSLQTSANYRLVMESSSAAVGDYLVRGKLYDFTEVDTAAIATRISLHLELVDARNNRIVWSHLYEREEPANGKDIKDVVDSMDRNLHQVIAQAVADLGKAISPSEMPRGAGP